MRLHFLAARRDRSRELWVMSADVIRLTTHLADRDQQIADRDQRLAAADETNAGLTADCAWFHDHWMTEANRANSAVAANHRLGVALADERRKIADLEKIAGRHVDSRHAASPIFMEVTGEHPLPVWRDKDETAELRTLTLADALGRVR
jgi:hypothetical protein